MLDKTTYIGCLTVYQLIALFRKVIDNNLTYILKRDRVVLIFNKELTPDETTYCRMMQKQFPLEFSII